MIRPVTRLVPSRWHWSAFIWTASLVVFTLLVLPDATAQQHTERYPVFQDGQWGYINASGAVVIEPQFDAASPFSDGLARVTKDGTYAFIDSTGTTVLEPDVAYVGSFSENRAPVRLEQNEQFGYIDKTGAVVIEPRFDRAHAFSDQRAAVYIGDTRRAEPGYGYINPAGLLVINNQFYGARRFSNGRAPVLVDGFVNGKWGFIDTTGTLVIEPAYDEALPFSEGFAAVAVGSGFDAEWGFVDTTGTQVIPTRFQQARSFGSGRAPVQDAFDDWKYIGPDGAPLSNEEYAYAEPFHGARARVSETASGGGRMHQGGPMQFDSGVAPQDWIYITPDEQTIWPVEDEAAPPSPSPSDQLRTLLPATLLGRERGHVRGFGERPFLRTQYTASDQPALKVQLGAGMMKDQARSSVEEADDQFVVNGYTAYVREQSSDMMIMLFPGEVALSISVEDAPAQERITTLRNAAEALGLDDIASFTLTSRQTDLAVQAPEGFETFTESWSDLQVGVAHPSEWASVGHMLIPHVILMSDASAAEQVSRESMSISSDQKVSLEVDGNTVVRITPLPNFGDTSPEVYFERMIGRDRLLQNAEETRPVESVELDAGTAAMTAYEGQDAEGRDTILQHWALRKNDLLVYVQAAMPAEQADMLAPTILRILNSLAVEQQ